MCHPQHPGAGDGTSPGWGPLSLVTSLSRALVRPVYLVLDEPQLADMVIALGADDEWPAPGERQVAAGVALSSNPYQASRCEGARCRWP